MATERLMKMENWRVITVSSLRAEEQVEKAEANLIGGIIVVSLIAIITWKIIFG